MTVYDAQPRTSYSDTGNVVRIISDVINLIDPVDTPLIVALGGLDAARNRLKIKGDGKKIEWIEDEYGPLTDVANQGTTITTNATTLTVTDGSIFQPGHVILIDAEYMWVSAVDVANNTIVVTRSFGGTNATHTTTAAIEIVGMARLEGDDADFKAFVDLTEPYNYTAILQQGLHVTGTDRVLDYYGWEDSMDYQANKAVPELMRSLEKMLFHGQRKEGSATTPRSFGGLGTYITNNTVDANGAIAKTDIDNLAEYILLDGGMPDLFVCNPAVANDLRALLDSSSFVRMTQENSVFGMQSIETIRTQYGSLRIVESRWCPVAKAWMLDSSKMGLYTLRPFHWHDLAVDGDSDKAEVLAELSFALANDKAHGVISGITS
jgi:hypothetical protein